MQDNDNLRELENAGVIVKTPLPQEYVEVLENLSAEEVAVIVKVKQELDRAAESLGKAPSETFTNFIVI